MNVSVKSARAWQGMWVYLVMAGLVLFGMQASAATKTWAGAATGGAWITGTNWSPAGAPLAGDDVILSGTGALAINNVPTISLASLTISNTNSTSGVTLTSPTGTFTITTSTLTISGGKGLTISSNLNLVITNGTISSSRQLTINSSRNLTVNGTLTINSAGTLTEPPLKVSGTVTVNSGGLINYTTGGAFVGNSITVNSGATLRLSGTSSPTLGNSITINGTLEVGGTFSAVASSPSPTYGSGGTLLYSGSSKTASFREWSTTSGPTNVTLNLSSSTNTVTLTTLSREIPGTLTLTQGRLVAASFTKLTFHTGNTPITRTGGFISLCADCDIEFGKTGSIGGNAFTIPNDVFLSTALSFDEFIVNRTNPITLNNQSITVDDFTFTSGLVIVGSGNITVRNVNGTPNATKMFVTSSTSGYVQHLFPAAGDIFTYPIGDNIGGTTEYSPIDLLISSSSGDRTIGFRAVDANHPSLNLPSAPANSLSRYWDNVVTPSTGTYDYDLDMNYLQADVNGSNEANIAPVAWSGSQPWTQYPGSINTTSNLLSIIGANNTTSPLGLPLTGREGAVGPNLTVSAITPNATTTACNSTSMSYSVTVRNSGNQAITSGTSIAVSAYTSSLSCGGTAVATQSFTTGLAVNATEVLVFNLPTIGNGQVSFQVDPANTIAEINDGDNCLSNNTVTLQTGLSGTYTVGSGGNYANFTAARNALVASGVCGPVVFEVISGTYNENISIPAITGVSATNTVTFRSASGNAADVVLQSSTTDVVVLNGADYFTFQNLTVSYTGASTFSAFELQDDADYVTIRGCVLNGGTSTSTAFTNSLVYISETTASLDVDNLVVENCTLNGAASGIYYASSTTNASGIEIKNNVFANNLDLGVFLDDADGPVITGNTFTNGSNASSSYTAIEITACDNGGNISGNFITSDYVKYGIVIDASNGTSGNPILVSNNMVAMGGTGTTYNQAQGIRLQSSSYVNVYFNTVNIYNNYNTLMTASLYLGGTITDGSINIVNNIFAMTGGGSSQACVYFNGAVLADVSAWNYNNYYTTGSSIVAYVVANRTTLANLQSYSSKDGNSVAINPGFTSASNLHVSAAGLKIAVSNFGIVTDIDGDPRTTSPYTIGADEASPATADAGITTVVSPVVGGLCAGNSDIVVTVRNYDTNLLNSITVLWTVNGGGLQSQTFTGLNLASNATTDLNLGTFNFVNNTSYVIEVATVDPNGLTDVNTANDAFTSASITAVAAGTWTGQGNDSDWFNPANWSCNTVPTQVIDVNIPSGISTYPVLVSTGGLFGSARSVSISSGASVFLPNGTRLEVAGNFANNGSANLGNGTLRLTNAAPHTISGNFTVGILTIEANSTLTGTVNLTEALNLVSGNLNTTGGSLRLKSNATNTAYINDFTSGYTGSVTGNVTVERYVNNTVNGFHYIGAPVGGSNLSDWSNEFAITGPNNAQVIPQPTCDPNALAQGSPYGSLFDYRESAVTTCYQSGWHVRSGTGSIGATQGFAGVIPNGTTIDLTGTPTTGNVNSAALSRTTANSTSTRGMHLVSNPYPSALDWYAVSNANSDLDGTAYLWLTSGGYQGTYQPVNAITPGSSFIGSSQGFFVEALAPGAVVNYTNSMRVAGNNSFFRQGQAFDSRLILEVSGNGYADRTIVAFGDDFTHGYDREFDGKKMQSKGGVMTLYTQTNSAYQRQATNALPNDRSVKVVPVGFAPGANGTFTFNATDLGTFASGTLIYLEDKKTGTLQNLMLSPEYTFAGGLGDAEDRFLLHFVPGIEWSTLSASCNGNDGALVLDLGSSEMNGTIISWDTYEVTDAAGSPVTTGTNANGTINLNNLLPGTYTVTLLHNGYQVVQDITIAGVPVVDAAAIASNNAVLEGEAVNFSNNSVGATSYLWSFGDGSTSTDASPVHAYAQEGVYSVTLTATNGTCTDVFTQTIVVSKLQDPTGIAELANGQGMYIFGFGKVVTIRFNNWADQQVSVEVYDLTGRKVIATQTLSTSLGEQQLHLPDAVNGYYFVRAYGASGSVVARVFLAQ